MLKSPDCIRDFCSVQAREKIGALLPHHAADRKTKNGMRMRVRYQIRLFLRFLLLILAVYEVYIGKDRTEVIRGMHFFDGFSPLHIIWIYWICETLLPTVASRGMISMGSIKYLQRTYIPSGKFKPERLMEYMKKSTKDSLKVFAFWIFYMTVLLAGYLLGLLRPQEMFIICAGLDVLDIIFVLYWCPLRAFFMKNRCCTTCRIFNWDHILIFSGLIFVPGFFSWSILALSLVEFLVWEFCFFSHPERFWEGSNQSLRCSQCTDRICEHTFTGKKKRKSGA